MVITPSRRHILLVVVVTIFAVHSLSFVYNSYFGEPSTVNFWNQQLKFTQNSTFYYADDVDIDNSEEPDSDMANSNETNITSNSSVTLRYPLSPDNIMYTPRRANATFVLLCRNSDMVGAIQSIQSVEDRFNGRHNYPWVLLNEEPFTDEFKERITALTGAHVEFGLIPHDHWFQPDWIDEEKAQKNRWRMMLQRIIYADSVPYRNMCRFNSGFFWRHELLQKYKWYWRVEPGVRYFCDIDYDPFLYMQDNDKVYSFTISLFEWEPTIVTLWDAVKEFITENPQYVVANNSMGFLSDDGGDKYNLCHFWSNFEIADLDFWRSEAYVKFFDHLESKGGFYYERWGDAPIHSIAAALFARKEQIHFFSDIGYEHPPFNHCPQGEEWARGRCSCNPADTFEFRGDSCLPRFERLFQ